MWLTLFPSTQVLLECRGSRWLDHMMYSESWRGYLYIHRQELNKLCGNAAKVVGKGSSIIQVHWRSREHARGHARWCTTTFRLLSPLKLTNTTHMCHSAHAYVFENRARNYLVDHNGNGSYVLNRYTLANCEPCSLSTLPRCCWQTVQCLSTNTYLASGLVLRPVDVAPRGCHYWP